jgi:hypothetical protein
VQGSEYTLELRLSGIERELRERAASFDQLREYAARLLESAERSGVEGAVERAAFALGRIDNVRATLRECRPRIEPRGTSSPHGKTPPGDTHAVTVHHTASMVK